MISVIISSAKAVLLKQVTRNIEDTIGVPFEIIAFNNSDGKKGICEVYNAGIRQASYDILCFMHEDVEMKTAGWGQIVIDKFKKHDLGLLGIAGNNYKTLTPSGWHQPGPGTAYANYIQTYKHVEKQPIHHYANPNNEKLAQVACLDGVWLCTTKKIAQEFMFDDVTFKGFHGYDIDFSLSIGQKYKVAVTFDVLLNHFSEGKYDNVWMEENLKLHAKWDQILPVNVGNIPDEVVSKIEKNAFKNFIDQLLHFKYPIKVPLSVLSRKRHFFNLDPLLFIKLNYHIVFRYLRGSKPAQAQA